MGVAASRQPQTRRRSWRSWRSWTSRTSRTVAVLACLALAVTLVGCRGTSKRDPGTGGPDELFGEVASFETVAGQPGRLMVGLSTTDGRVLAGGDVNFEISPATGKAQPIKAVAHYISVPGLPAVAGAPRIGRPSQGTGVYAAAGVNVPKVGFWTIRLTLPGPLAKQHPEAAFEARAKAQVPAVGSDAPRTQNLTLASPGVQPEWLDSSSSANTPPDRSLHSTVIADALTAHRPIVVVVSTPAFCTSRFCGPTTEIVRELAAADSGHRVDYVHLEVWRDFEKRVVNTAAAEWIVADGSDGREPWIFLVNSRGKIVSRFDNVAPTDELTAAVAALH